MQAACLRNGVGDGPEGEPFQAFLPSTIAFLLTFSACLFGSCLNHLPPRGEVCGDRLHGTVLTSLLLGGFICDLDSLVQEAKTRHFHQTIEDEDATLRAMECLCLRLLRSESTDLIYDGQEMPFLRVVGFFCHPMGSRTRHFPRHPRPRQFHCCPCDPHVYRAISQPMAKCTTCIIVVDDSSPPCSCPPGCDYRRVFFNLNPFISELIALVTRMSYLRSIIHPSSTGI